MICPDLLLELQIHISGCLLEITTEMFHRHLQSNASFRHREVWQKCILWAFQNYVAGKKYININFANLLLDPNWWEPLAFHHTLYSWLILGLFIPWPCTWLSAWVQVVTIIPCWFALSAFVTNSQGLCVDFHTAHTTPKSIQAKMG